MKIYEHDLGKKIIKIGKYITNNTKSKLYEHKDLCFIDTDSIFIKNYKKEGYL